MVNIAISTKSIEAVDNIIRGDILFAISQHEFSFAHISQFNSLAEILIIADELEEFSRFGRQMLSRKYHDTTAESNINLTTKTKNQKKYVKIEIEYSVAPQWKIDDFFVRKAEKLCKIFSLEKDGDYGKYYQIESISMKVIKGDVKFYFILLAERYNRGFLPKTKINGKIFNEKEYFLLCDDDKLYVIPMIEKGEDRIPLKIWFENVPQEIKNKY